MNELGYGQKAWPTGSAQPAVFRPGNISRPTATRQAWLCRPGQDILPDPQTSGVPTPNNQYYDKLNIRKTYN